MYSVNICPALPLVPLSLRVSSSPESLQRTQKVMYILKQMIESIKKRDYFYGSNLRKTMERNTYTYVMLSSMEQPHDSSYSTYIPPSNLLGLLDIPLNLSFNDYKYLKC